MCDVMYHWFGTISSSYPRTVIAICLIFTGLMTFKVARTPEVSAMDGYASDDARSKVEFNSFQQFLNSDGAGISLGILLKSNDNGSMIRSAQLEETVKIIDLVSTQFPMFNEEKGRNETFEEFCYGFCQANEPVRQYYNGIQIVSSNDTDSVSQRIHLAYPTSSMFGREFSLLPNYFGVEAEQDGTLKSVSLIVLYFRAEKHKTWTKQMVKDWEINLGHYFNTSYNSSNLKIHVYSPAIVEKEIVRSGDLLRPFMFVGFAIMTSFCSLTTIISGVTVYGQQATFRKIILSVIACINSFMACGCAFGIMFFCGITFSPLLCITPFLVLAISVDDSFLMIHAWNRLMMTNSKISREKAITDVLVHSGAAISISAATNILAFAVGAFTSPPEIRIFCIGNAACIIMDVIFQSTFFTASMFLLADEPVENYQRSYGDRIRKYVTKFTKFYVHQWTKPLVSFVCFFLWIVYMAGAVYGLFQVHVDLSSDKMFPPDSPVIEIDHMRSKDVVPFYNPAMIVINEPGDLMNKTNVEKLIQMKESFERMASAIGPESSKFFLTDYMDFLESMSDIQEEFGEEEGNSTDSLSSIEDFLNWPEYSFWRGFLSIKERPSTIGNGSSEKYVDKFMFSTGYHGKELQEWSARGDLLDKWREEVDKYPEFNATIFTDAAFYLDVLEKIPSTTSQSVIVTFICVIFVCMLFISHPTTVVVVSTAILSTCLGVFGYLSLFGISLDPVMMSISIMCIGFSVDIPAHVSFHFFASKRDSSSGSDLSITSDDEEKEDLEHKLCHTLCSVGFPVLQAGLSTDLCTLPLLFVNLYMAKVFAWSLMFCVTLSLIHGLMFIPLLFSMNYHIRKIFSRVINLMK
ncbi:unnamed protein product [Auanema sp. JU1783]|nr:unnamed protein product [Auanema sp. JU1783]